jgi:hypothetical protein
MTEDAYRIHDTSIPIGSLVLIDTDDKDTNHQKIGLVVTLATPRNLSELSGQLVEEWLWRELGDHGAFIESAYIIKVGLTQTVYSYSELVVVGSNREAG